MNKSLLFAPLLFAACSAETQTFVVSQIVISSPDTSFGRDIDLDGEIDNSMPEWDQIWTTLGVNSQENLDALLQNGDFNIGLDLTARVGGDELRGYMADSTEGFLFDGSDELLEVGEAFSFDDAKLERASDDASNLRARGRRFVWAMSLFDTLFLLPLDQVVVTGDISHGEFSNGELSGFIRAEEVAAILPSIPLALDKLVVRDSQRFAGGAVLPCEGDAAGVASVCEQIDSSSFCTDRAADGVVTGACVSLSSQSRVFLEVLDANRDGAISVVRDLATGGFIENELTPLFDLASSEASPEGVFGDLFTLDINRDGRPDSMGVGVGFQAVSALKAP